MVFMHCHFWHLWHAKFGSASISWVVPRSFSIAYPASITVVKMVFFKSRPRLNDLRNNAPFFPPRDPQSHCRAFQDPSLKLINSWTQKQLPQEVHGTTVVLEVGMSKQTSYNKIYHPNIHFVRTSASIHVYPAKHFYPRTGFYYPHWQ